MNLGRFHAAVDDVRWEIESTDTLNQLDHISRLLDQSISQPTPDIASQFKSAVDTLLSALANAPSNLASPSKKKAYEEIGGLDFLGEKLGSTINDILSRNSVIPVGANGELKQLRTNISQLLERLRVILSAFESLQIDFDDIADDEIEIGVCLPWEIFGRTLPELSKELRLLGTSLQVFADLVGAEKPNPTIRTIGSSELQVFLDSVPGMAVCLSVTIERILRLYKLLLEIRKDKRDLAAKYPDKITKPLDDYSKTILEEQVAKIVDETIKAHALDARKISNQQKIQLKHAVYYFLERFDKGATVEIRVLPPEAPPALEEGGDATAHQKLVKQYEDKKSAADLIANSQIEITKKILVPNSETLALNLVEEENESVKEGAKEAAKKKDP